MLGWDITDFGSGDYSKIGLLMITLRNGNFNDKKYVKTYAEKLLIVQEEQITPFHFHWSKMEDIINRGGGNLIIQVYNSTENEEMDKVNPVTIMSDGRKYQVEPGAFSENVVLTKREIIKKVCGFCKIHFIDSYEKSGFTREIAALHGDGVHPDEEYRDKIALFVIDEIKKAIK